MAEHDRHEDGGGSVSGQHETTSAPRRGAGFGLAAAALFGASAPLSKLLLPRAAPLTLSALLYLGAGLALTVVRMVASRRAGGAGEARLRGADVLLLAGIVLFGGVAGPALMLTGLSRVSGLAGALLLNLEAPFTMLLAVLLFREHLGRHAGGAAALIVIGAAVVGVRPGELSASWVGATAIVGACLCWGIDNNLSQRLSLRDPVAVVQMKTLAAGVCSMLLGRAFGEAPPETQVVAPALAMGAVCYGVSLVCDMQALRLLGAAREAAYFATAPFIGAVLAIPLLGDRATGLDAVGAGLMVAGVVVLRREVHVHVHTHEVVEHDHVHVHDEHHQHAHEEGVAVEEPHAHAHRHEAITHEHAHVPDLHHRHGHE